MKPEDQRDQLVDMLLRELVSSERPPDVYERVMEAARQVPAPEVIAKMPAVRPVVLPSARPSRWPAVAIAAAVTLLGVLGVLLQLQRIAAEKTPLLSSFSGSVNRSVGVIPAGGKLVTGEGAAAVLTYQDGTKVELGPNASMMVTESSVWDRSKGIEVFSGKLSAEVMPQPSGHPLAVRSEDAVATVVGTKLTFHKDTERSRLEVAEGAVRFLPTSNGQAGVLVESGCYAEAGADGFHYGKIVEPPVPGIVSFTLMNADTDQPIRTEPLKDGETILLSSLPTRNLNIRADYQGETPKSVRIHVKRHRGKPTGLGANASKVHEYPPFFVAGDYWADGRPEDCVAWQAPPGYYHLSAKAIYADERKQEQSTPLEINFWIDQ